MWNTLRQLPQDQDNRKKKQFNKMKKLPVKVEKKRIRRKGVHSKNNHSKNKKSKNYVKAYAGQGR